MGKKETIAALELENLELHEDIKRLKKQLKDQNNDDLLKEKEELISTISQLKSELSFMEGMNDDIELGIYNPETDFINNDYISEWKEVRSSLKVLSKSPEIIEIIEPMKLGGSEKRGVKLQNDITKIGVVHLNNMANILFKNVNQVNYENQLARFDKEFAKINKIFTILKVNISDIFRQEILKSFDVVIKMKLQKEKDKEDARLERERIKEEEKLQNEVNIKLEKIDSEVEKYKTRIEKIKLESSKNAQEKDKEIEELKNKINKLKNDEVELNERLKRTGAGYVYIISNIGSFGENIYKIGVTRRLEPEIRIRELSSASVPFIFDKHALIWSEKAFKLESQLHQAFDDSRVNKINKRKEFFRTTLNEIKLEISKLTDTSIKWIDTPDAIQYRLTLESEGK